MAKLHYCFLERFNNYFNRKIIRYSGYDELEDYIDHSANFYIPQTIREGISYNTLFDFNPNDNITTEIICNEVPFDPDYFLLFDEDDKIVSRWFVLEQKRNRQGQWVYYLRRDVISDSYDEISTAPLYVERGIINDISSPLLTNNEDLRVNQIKKQEILLKDRTESAWIVIYLKKGVLGNNQIGPNNDGKIPINVPSNTSYEYITLTVPMASWQYWDYQTTDYKVNNKTLFDTYWMLGTETRHYQVSNISPYNSSLNSGLHSTNLMANHVNKSRMDAQYKVAGTMGALTTQTNSSFGYFANNALMEFNGKIIKDSLGKYYEVRVYMNSSNTTTHNVTSSGSPTLKSTMNTLWNNANDSSQTANDNAFTVKVSWEGYRLEITERTDLQTSFDLASYTGQGTEDSPLFDAVCMPYGAVRIYGTEGLVDITTSSVRSMLATSSFARVLTSEYVLDMQVLPYCPVQNLITPNVTKQMGFRVFNDSCIGAYDADSNLTDVMYVCNTANFTLDIIKKISISDSSDVPDVYKMKYINDCTMIRLCSPNYNGLYEMNLAKNGGEITSFNVDVTLRPFNPYIHVNPDFNFLYGSDFNDVRGLLCNGDFSLGIINDAWNVYEIQNKNYQAIFDRQIQNLDINNSIAMTEAKWGAVAGTIQGASAGAVGGAMVGGGYGAIAGAVIGGVASGAGGLLDIQNLEKRQQEARSYAIDNFTLQLGNVRALPNSITKTSALTYNNKLFPFIEIYECSEVEKQAYYEKIRYNGMSVRIIDRMENYRSLDNSNYFRARLIRMTNISEDNHYLEAINEELMKGVYI